ncbi:MAG TPA: LodA/GoxA family CTQ-dependent oxidase, partial [Allosphingosinicella sp.]|nr:LodA/GoxA family CTQ-dependent oxidase [Allosphingosinicella sp.]
MAITAVKIHPAIGIARVGNSPDEFFVGPERRWQRPDPQGGFKDAQCRVKRQAARFRVFAYHDNGTVQELTSADAKISWTVHLANRKAVTRNSGAAADLTIDPGSRTLEGPNKRKLFDTGQIRLPNAPAVTVPLGEARTDQKARLLVLGGFGKSASPTNPPSPLTSFLDNPGWYDDISDGPVTAKVKLLGSGQEFQAAGAWVVVGPPKFSPLTDNVISLFDTVAHLAIGQGWLPAPAQPSYTNDIFPILQSAHDVQWTENVSSTRHAWAHPVYDAATREAIFSRLANPAGGGSNMPRLNGATLTGTQYLMMERWKDGNFAQDWAGPPSPDANVSPAGLDRSALENCVGAAFFPGIEAGGIAQKPVVTPGNYLGAADPMRLNHAVLGPGSMSEFMALPWQADFHACGTQWWPVPRPNSVFPQGSNTRQAWDRDVLNYQEMVDEWHTLGFIIEQNGRYVEVDRCDTSFVTLLTQHLVFQDVPQGPMGTARKVPLAIAFEVRSPGAAVTLEHVPGSGPANSRLSLAATSVTVGPTVGNAIATARLWLVYETGPAGEVISDQLSISNPANGQSWTIHVSANTVARKTAGAVLVLDRSGSMTEDRGDGQSKHQSLMEAASIFVDVMLEGDGVGLVRYNDNAQPLQPVTTLGAPDDASHTARQDTKNVITGGGLNPGGSTSIGDGIFEGRQLLDSAGAFDLKSMLVLTDGKENSPRWISDVSGEINQTTYAVGLGTPQNTSAAALQTLAGNHGGYLLVTGAIAGDNQFILQKYFLQILAGISNADVVLDPEGTLVPGLEQRIPFLLTEADAGVDVILLTSRPGSVDFRLQTPNGFILEPWRAMDEPS